MQEPKPQEHFISRMVRKVVDTVLPPRCPVSGEPVEKQGMLAPETWRALEFITEPYCECCGLPFEFEVTPGALCASCLEDLPVFSMARAAVRYNETSRTLILGFKHGDKLYAVKTLTPMLQQAGAAFLETADYLVPVPLHYWRLVRRRYNQAALMARDLEKSCGVPCLSDALRRVRATPSQGHKKAGDRKKNVRGAFALNPRYRERIQGKSIVLVDDVLTTGATVNECAKALLEAGAGAVNVLAVAKTVKS